MKKETARQTHRANEEKAESQALQTTDAKEKRRGWFLICLFFFVALYLIPIFPHGGSANELTRWATAASLVEKGSFEISWTEPLVGPIVDTAKVGDKVYSNKAPSVTLLGLPGYLLAKAVTGAPNAGNIRLSWTLMRWLVATLPLLLLAYWLARHGASTFTLAATLFATPLFLYSLLLFSHVLAAVAIFFAYRLLFAAKEPSIRHCILAGLLCGLAVTAEFPAAVPTLVFGCALLVGKKPAWSDKLKSAAFFILGGLPFAIGLAAYNADTFGSPFSFSYAHEAFAEWAEVANQGFLGISWPTPEKVFLLLLSPSRGLFFYSPVLTLSVVWMIRHWRDSDFRQRVRAVAVLATTIVVCGHGAPHGGWSAGARYLVLILPLLLEPLSEGAAEQVSLFWRAVLLGVSILLCVMPALTFPFAPPEFSFPHNDFWRPLMAGEGWATPTLGAFLGLGAGLLALLPLLFCLAGVFAIVWQASGSKDAVLGFVAAAILFSAYISVPWFDSDEAALRRATIAERFFKPANRVESFRRKTPANDLKSLRDLYDKEWLIMNTRGYAPNDFPYLKDAALIEGPTSRQKRVQLLWQQGDSRSAEKILRDAQQELPLARCELAGNLAVLLYNSNRKGEALQELENARSLARPETSANCLRVLFLLGSLYQEQNRSNEAATAFQEYISATTALDDRQTAANRQSAQRALATLGQPAK
jgi:hypothetical protein